MANRSLPNVLREYDSEYEEKSDQKSRNDRDHDSRHQAASPRGKKQSTSPRPCRGKDGRSPPPPPSREPTVELKRRQERQHHERMYKTWEHVKETVRESETERFKEKIALQHELHRIQQQQQEQRQQQRHQRYLKKREREKAEKAAKNDALQQICRDSLEEDKRLAKEKRAAEQREKLHKSNEQHSFPTGLLDVPQSHLLAAESPPAGHVQDKDQVEPPSEDPRGSLASGSLYLPGASLDGDADHFETVPEEGEEVLEEDEEGEEEEVLPWHHLQLYELYGKDADYFLHPKIETEKKADIVLNPRLKAIGVPAVAETLIDIEQGRAGAGTLWDVLRNESRMRLIRQDSKLLSPELKSAFGAFAREGLANQKRPVKRNFYSSEDVPDMDKLMDQSRIHNAQDFRHKVELMFRSSTINQDRTKVLLYNNPPPDLNNQQGSDGVQRYMPSWAETWEKDSELSYKKWLQSDEPQQPSSISYTPSYHDDQTTPTNEMRGGSSPRRQRHTARQDQKYVFLTEEQARTPGQFTRRHKEQEEAKHRPSAYGDQIPAAAPAMLKSVSAMASLGGGDYIRAESPSPRDSVDKIQSDKQRARSEMSSQFISQWEPLSLNALLEYRENQDAMGRGKFNQGKTPVWSGTSSVSAR